VPSIPVFLVTWRFDPVATVVLAIAAGL